MEIQASHLSKCKCVVTLVCCLNIMQTLVEVFEEITFQYIKMTARFKAVEILRYPVKMEG